MWSVLIQKMWRLAGALQGNALRRTTKGSQMPAAQANCQTCHGQGQPAGCPDCGGTTSAVQTRQSQQGQAVTKGRRKWPWVLGILAALGLLGTGGYFLFRNSPSDATETAMNGKQPAPAASSNTNLDPTKPGGTSTAVAQKEPECPDGTLWDTKRKVCVQPATVPPFPSSIAITMPCPSNCAPEAPPPATASASAPAPKAPPTNTPAKVVPVKVDLTLIGNPAAFPPGN